MRSISRVCLAVAMTAPGAAWAQQFSVPRKTITLVDNDAIGREVPNLSVAKVRLRDLPRMKNAMTKARLEKIADTIEAGYKNNCVGYSFVVGYNNLPGMTVARAGGVARRAPDPSPRAMTTADRIAVASVSKTFTAVALLKLLAEKNIGVDTAIGAHLPKDLTVHPSVAAITFRQLLTHTSGLRDLAEPDYATLKTEIAAGVKAGDKVAKYQNSNYGMLRLLIPVIESGYVPTGVKDDYARSYLYGIQTMDSVNKRVFAPAGLGRIYCANEDAQKCLSYQYPSPVQQGQDWGDQTARNAYCGFNMTPTEMSKAIRALLYSEKIMPKPLRETMLAEHLGIWHDDVGDLDEFSHGGWHPGNPTPGKYNFGEVGTGIMGYSNGVSVALLINSQLRPNPAAKGISSSEPVHAAILKDLAENK